MRGRDRVSWRGISEVYGESLSLLDFESEHKRYMAIVCKRMALKRIHSKWKKAGASGDSRNAECLEPGGTGGSVVVERVCAGAFGRPDPENAGERSTRASSGAGGGAVARIPFREPAR